MKRLVVFSIGFILFSIGIKSQTLEKMLWFNEPEQWEIKNNSLSMFVTPQSDYWRISHYGFTVDDAPFYYATYGGEFEAKVKITGAYKARFDQAGLMIRIDEENYIKAGIEYVDGKYNLSTVVTHKTSDWSVISLDKPIPYIWIKAVRRLDAIEIFYSFDDQTYVMMRNAWMQDNTPVQIGMMAACPDGDGFNVSFEQFLNLIYYFTICTLISSRCNHVFEFVNNPE
jgi:regulation of enolase protein 1 (concanavalin A-like superfamily)